MATDNSTRIAEIDAILRTGAEQVTIDGETVRYNFDELRRERLRLERGDDQRKRKRPVASSINLGNA